MTPELAAMIAVVIAFGLLIIIYTAILLFLKKQKNQYNKLSSEIDMQRPFKQEIDVGVIMQQDDEKKWKYYF